MHINERILLGIVRVSERFKKESSALFKKSGLTFSQYNVLRILEQAKNGRQPITIISNKMLTSGANMTGIAKRLEKNGFILRKGSTDDERVKLLEITSRGRETLAAIDEKRVQYQKHFLTSLSKEQKDDLLNALKKILKSTVK
ncbi:MAG: MarR family transcriptional regulator [Desulfobacteraceae bacterium]|nr:MarR family transcriptional regulator [Desulfobacteraceae bacterium]